MGCGEYEDEAGHDRGDDQRPGHGDPPLECLGEQRVGGNEKHAPSAQGRGPDRQRPVERGQEQRGENHDAGAVAEQARRRPLATGRPQATEVGMPPIVSAAMIAAGTRTTRSPVPPSTTTNAAMAATGRAVAAAA